MRFIKRPQIDPNENTQRVSYDSENDILNIAGRLSLFKDGINEFTFTLPKSENTVTFKLLTHGDEQKIDAEIKGLQKINPNVSTDLTTRMKYIITSINGDRDQKNIRDFIDTYLLAPDARALRQYYNQISPDIDMKYKPNDENYVGEGIDIPIGLNFFWPDGGVSIILI
jgi:hypothetical protein